MKRSIVSVWMLAVLSMIPTLRAAQLAGKFTDGKLACDFADAPGGTFSGTLTLSGQQFPCTAHTTATGFDGTFTSGGNNFAFTAVLDNDTLTLITAGTTYKLKRVLPPQNPLAAPPANPLAAASGDGPLAAYTVEASTDSGKSLLCQKTGITSIQAALEGTFPDLAKYFGARPEIGKAYEDAKDHRTGGATFSAKLNGQPVKGFVSCKLVDGGGASVAVIFDRADAGKADWDKLTSPAPTAAAAAAAVPSPEDLAKVLGPDAQVYKFPDGTGTITLAAGWKTQAQSAINGIFIQGPKDQNIAIGSILSIQTPDSPLMKMIERNEAMTRKLGGTPPARVPMLAANFTDPVQAMTDLNPQISKINEAHGGPTAHLDKIISHQDIPSELKDGKAAIICWDVTRTLNGNSSQYRGLATIQIGPTGQGMWMYALTGFTAPQATFDQDRPIMFAMIRSEHIDAQVASQRLAEQSQQQMAMLKQQADANSAQLQRQHDQFMQDQAQRFADGQARHAEQMAGYQQHNDQWAADELQKSRRSADFIETIKGTRTIYDTQTGSTGTADLNYASGVVDQLNTAALDPNRFVQIPLRDEMYPLPAGNGK